jgi:hypothetical protein
MNGHGPRKRSIYAGVYSAGSLGSIQKPKKDQKHFTNPKSCRVFDKHTWIIGESFAVCSTCGRVKPKQDITNALDT